MNRRVYLHLGAPKTGTTYLQSRLSLNRSSLAAHGVHLPTGSRLFTPEAWHFKAAVDLLEQDWGGAPGHAAGAWPKLVKAVHRLEGTVVVSHEIFGAAKPQYVARALAELGHQAELHLVFSARDVARQVPAGWQETVKQGRKLGYRRFLRRTVEGETWFSRAFDLPAVLEKWGADLPADRIHVVTVPHDRSRSLWLRYCEAFGIDPAWAPRDSRRANESLGAPETMMLLELNRRFPGELRRTKPYDDLVRELLAHQTLAGRGSQPVRLPPRLFGWAEEEGRRWADWVRERGVHVVGDLDDLQPRRPAADEPWVRPGKARNKDKLAAAMDALEALTHEAARRRDPDSSIPARARGAVARLRAQD